MEITFAMGLKKWETDTKLVLSLPLYIRIDFCIWARAFATLILDFVMARPEGPVESHLMRVRGRLLKITKIRESENWECVEGSTEGLCD